MLKNFSTGAAIVILSMGSEHESNIYLHTIGIPAYTRKTVGPYLKSLGAHIAPPPQKEVTYLSLEPPSSPPPR